MAKRHLTKSNFKLGTECKQKLKFKKADYPSTLEENEMLQFFARGGFMVEALAHSLMKHSNPSAEFEVTFEHERFSARVDGWQRFRDFAILTEIKATTVESDGPEQFLKKNGDVNKSWLPYLIDITFQVMVARRANPGLEIRPELCVVNKTKPCGLEAIYSNIDIVDSEEHDRSKPRAVFRGDVKALAADHFLEFIDVSEAVDALMPDVELAAADFLDFIDGNQPKFLPERLPSKCKKCEYRGSSLTPNGFDECWGPAPKDEPHILDIYQGYRSKESLEVFRRMSESNNYRLVDLPSSIVDSGKSWARARRNQVNVAKSGVEFQSPELAEKLRKVEYPIHFIDFEASTIPVPYLPGMKPYEQVAFQFSCHTLESAESTELKHSQWLNLKDAYPAAEFSRELRKVIGDAGTVFVWSHYERTTLNAVRRQLRERGELDASLDAWFTTLVGESSEGDDESDNEVSTRLFDLLELSRDFYCHPMMNGSHSIKRVLDAIWSQAEFLWIDPWFSRYYKADASGRPMDPYKTLVANDQDLDLGYTEDAEEGGSEGSGVTDGVGAMRAYQDMIYGRRRGNEAHRARLAEALYRYCGLDTAAMVMIWKYWLHAR